VSADNHRSSYSFRPRVELKLQALAKRWGVTPTRYMEMMIEREAFEAGVTVTNADVIRYNDAMEREKQQG
jgi:hypothetical protein